MRSIKKSFSFKLIVFITMISFVSCAKFANEQKISTSSKTGAGTAVQKIRVALWDYDIVEYDKKLIDAFSGQNPNIRVEVVSCSNAYYYRKLSVMLAGGEDIDVFYLNTAGQYKKMIEKGHLKPLDVLIARDKIDLKPYGDVMEGPMKSENRTYGIPYRSDTSVLYYNKDIFDRSKVPYPMNDITWEDFREIGKRLTSGEGENKTYGIFILPNPGFYLASSMQKVKDIDLVNCDLNVLKPGIELFMNIYWVDRSAVDYVTNKSLNADQRTFEQGNTAMFVNGTWFINYLVNDRKIWCRYHAGTWYEYSP